MAKEQSFSEKLKAILDEKGLNQERELVHVVRMVRQDLPMFSMQRLILLTRGSVNPSPEEIQALAVALDVHPRIFITDQDSIEETNRLLALEFASKRMVHPELANEFANFVKERANFRSKVLDSDDLYHLYHQFKAYRCDDEV